MSMLACLTCKISLEDSTALKNHHHTEWHKYNLHRKISLLPPLPLDEYKQRLQESSVTSSEVPTTSRIICQFCEYATF